jgi:hypothetical protein
MGSLQDYSLITFGCDPFMGSLQLQITPNSFHSFVFLFFALLTRAGPVRPAKNKNPGRRQASGSNL